jgi:hypothetical protein
MPNSDFSHSARFGPMPLMNSTGVSAWRFGITVYTTEPPLLEGRQVRFRMQPFETMKQKKAGPYTGSGFFEKTLNSIAVGQHSHRVFKQLLEIIQECCTGCSIHGSVIATQGDLHHIAWNHLTIFHNGNCIDSTDSQDA